MRGEDEDEDAEEKADAAVGEPLVQRGGGSWTWEVSAGSARTSPSFERACGLDPGIGRRARELRAEPLRVRPQLCPLAAQLVELDVQLQDGDVDRDHAREQRRDDGDPDDTAERACLRARAGERRGTAARAGDPGRLDACGAGDHQAFTAARSFAEAERGFASTSAELGRSGLRVSSRRTGSLPHVQIGNSGGQVQPRACSRK